MSSIRRIVIVGGGTAGWMTAAALAKTLHREYSIRLIESDEIAIIGVGEATIPPIRDFNKALGIDEDDFLRNTQGTFKLGIEFVNWHRMGASYIHAFGRLGHDLKGVPFDHYWLRQYLAGKASALEKYSINAMASSQAKCMRAVTDMPGSPMGDIAHAFHFDASLYARYLRTYSEARGVQRTEGKIVGVTQREPDGHIDELVLESGERINGDLFIDCSGMRGLLIEQTLKTGFEDWSHWLPCDRAIAVPCASTMPPLPYTRSTAHDAGWQWRIPLQHRIGNGHVFSSQFMSEDEAASILLSNLDSEQLVETRTIRYVTGKRRKLWNRNCIAIGLSSGFLEPLESTSIHLIQTMIARLIRFLPNHGFIRADIDEFNAQAEFEYERIRDFIILHYKATERNDTPFWQYCQNMSIPPTLQKKIDLYRGNGRILRENNELFSEYSWLQVLHGQGIRPSSYSPLANNLQEDELTDFLDGVENIIGKCIAVMPTHAEFIAAHCSANSQPG
ncbi:MAG TPA: tryptophan halogenase family protein [Novimethylophilus sp.]|jgi:tryptophan halogenase|uniref:tryptophan halogenase family protein n=1 Tax=Novimethylophilus sp. TaxID=2137426 RepID=UPI002F41C7FB